MSATDRMTPASTLPAPPTLHRRDVLALHERLLEPLGLTYCQHLVLIALETGGMRRPALRARLLLSARTMEDALGSSLASGLIRQEPDGRGAASGVLDLTDRGRGHLPRLVEIGDRVREQSGTTAEDRALLRRLIASTT